MADDEQEEPRRPRRTRRKAESEQEQAAGPDARDGHRGIPAQAAARRAAEHVVDFTGRDVETVVAIDSADDGWKVGVEVVETRRIPDTQDVLAIYEVRVDGHGDLVSYRRTRRYARSQLDGRCQ
ncbi:gas vesicle protein GvpO [Pseudonocardia adelaidensis]|uniref:Gas vesicle protein GvpO n=1 Tax=Pseudonocardia adelaidensis TaxID=648754 RepID=A0ABP9NIH5_9PSEU